MAGNTGNIRWSKRMDDALIDVLLEEVSTGGKKTDNGWKHESLVAVKNDVKEKANEIVDVKNVRSRLKTLRWNYNASKLALSLSGFGYDPVNECITASDQVWADFVQAHPLFAKLRNKGVPRYYDLSAMFGNDNASGNKVVEGHDIPSDLPIDEVEDLTVDEDTGMNFDDGRTQVPYTSDAQSNAANASSSMPSLQRSTPSQKRKRTNSMDEASSAMVDVSRELALASKMLAVSFSLPDCARIAIGMKI